MGEPFDAVVLDESQGARFPEVRLCVRCDLAGETVLHPVSRACSSIVDLEAEARKLHEELDMALDRGRRALAGGSEPGTPGPSDDMSAEELWHVLETVNDDALFVQRFNQLDESSRRRVAEYVLTSCSVFSGRPAVFSSRYHADTALLDE
ncbi:MAG: hypothetical protein ACQET7_05400 [Thermodesulfobacteriota bacterium]